MTSDDETPDSGAPEKAPPVKGLSKVTTTYDPTEDRVALSGELDDGSVLKLWVTRPMLERLVPELCRWLEDVDKAKDLPRAEVLQSFKQQKAASSLERSAPVQPDAAADSWLVTSIDVQRRPQGVGLVFRAPDRHEERIGLALQPVPLRQWLQILLAAYRRGKWPLDAWPVWMQEQAAAAPPGGVQLH